MGVVVAEEAAVVVPSEVQTSQARFQRFANLASFTCLDTASCVCVCVCGGILHRPEADKCTGIWSCVEGLLAGSACRFPA